MAQRAQTIDDDLVVLSADEISALQAPYDDEDVPAEKPETVEAKPVVKTEKKIEAKPEAVPAKRDVEFESMRTRLQNAEKLVSDERVRRIEAERVAHEKTARAAVADVDVVESQYSSVANAMEKAKTDNEAAQRDHAAALEAGDYKAATLATSRMATIAARISRLEDGKAALEERVTTARATAKAIPAEAPKEEAPTDPVERYVAQFGPREQSWLRSHPECVTDEEMNAKVLWGDKAARKAGIKAGSDEYFGYLDKHMGYVKDEAEEVETEDDEPEVVVEAKAKSAPAKRVAAPVSRGSVLSKTSDGRPALQLTAAQRAMAADLGMTNTEYGLQQLALEKKNSNSNYR